MCSCTMLCIYTATYSATELYNVIIDMTPASIKSNASISLFESLSQLDAGEGQEPRCLDGFVALVWECPLAACECCKVGGAKGTASPKV